MDDFSPRPAVNNISIINHIVTITHSRTISATTISEALSASGFEVFDIVADPRTVGQISTPTTRNGKLEDAVQRWDARQHLDVDETTRLMHEANCQMCASHGTTKYGQQGLDGVVSEVVDPIPLYSATLSIEGMTCSACIATVTNALQPVKRVDSVNVSLISHSATVTFSSDETDTVIKALVQAADDAGYDAELLELKDVTPTIAPTKASQTAEARTVSLRIDGMHCPRCPDRIVEAIRSAGIDVPNMPTLESPILTITYIPNAPRFTLRQIVSMIGALDVSFTIRVSKGSSIEQRSRQMLQKEQRAILLRALLAITAAIPSLVIGVVYMNLMSKDNSGYQYLMRRLHGISRAEWANFIIATPVYFFAADYFHRRMLKEIYSMWRPRSPYPMLRRFYRFGSMNMLISLGTSIAYFASLGELIATATRPSNSSEDDFKQMYFDSVVFLTMFLLLGRSAEARMKAKSGDAISALGKLRPQTASLVNKSKTNGAVTIEEIDADLVDVGDTVRIMHGSSPPCDGTLLDNFAELDESSLTGESRIVRKHQGDQICSGTINKGGQAVSIKVTSAAGASMLDSIIQIVREGQSKRAPMERIADLLTSYFVPVVVLIAIVTWLIWLSLGLSGVLPADYLDISTGGWGFWSLQFAIAVFVIACPCGLGLAAPTALFVGGGLAAKHGILVKGGGEAFQEASTLDAVVFDKTGTLTEGVEPKIVEHRVYDDVPGLDRSTVLGMLRVIEADSSHPLARAAINFANAEDANTASVSDAQEIAGKGLKATIQLNGEKSGGEWEALVGNEALMKDHDVDVPHPALEELESWKGKGYSVILSASRARTGQQGWRLNGIFAASDPIRTEAADVVKQLQAHGLQVWMVSGDNPKTAHAVGAQVGIPPDNIIAGVLPAQKAEKIRYLQQVLVPNRTRGFHSALMPSKRTRATIAFVGDGINDAPALTAADVGIAVASGSDVAVQSASFVLVQSDLRSVLTLTSLSRVIFRRIILNFMWAALYNVIALPVAAGVLYPIKTAGGSHIRLDPAWAALAMALSSVSVVTSSLLLKTKIPLIGFRG